MLACRGVFASTGEERVRNGFSVSENASSYAVTAKCAE